MSNFIFTTEKVTKQNWFARIKQIMINAGWQNISSKPSVDYNVMFSTGESGDKSMVFQMKEFDGSSSANGVSNSTSRGVDLRLPKSYIPGVAGAAGTFERPSESWSLWLMAKNVGIEVRTELTIHYHCNKNRLVLFTEYPSVVLDSKASFFFVGVSDRSGKAESNSSGPVIVATNFYSINGALATDNLAGTKTTAFVNPFLSNLSPNGANAAGKLFMTEVAYGHTEDGVRGYIDGVYMLEKANTTVISGDKLVDDQGREYRVIEVDTTLTSYNTSFKSPLLAFRVL